MRTWQSPGAIDQVVPVDMGGGEIGNAVGE